MEKNATQTISRVGTGGMGSKIKAAKTMMLSGVPMVIANGRKKRILQKILSSNKIGTFFHPSINKMKKRENGWQGVEIQKMK